MSNVQVSIDSNGIAIIEYPLHAIVTLQDIQTEYQLRISITNKKVPILVNLHGVSSFNEEAQRFVSSDQYAEITMAAAVVLDPKAGYFEPSKLLLDLFKNLNPAPYDIRVFEDIKPAKAWLKTYL